MLQYYSNTMPRSLQLFGVDGRAADVSGLMPSTLECFDDPLEECFSKNQISQNCGKNMKFT